MPGEGLNGREFVVTTDYPPMRKIAVPFVFRRAADAAATGKTAAK
jgi:hypothetical protein